MLHSGSVGKSLEYSRSIGTLFVKLAMLFSKGAAIWPNMPHFTGKSKGCSALQGSPRSGIVSECVAYRGEKVTHIASRSQVLLHHNYALENEADGASKFDAHVYNTYL